MAKRIRRVIINVRDNRLFNYLFEFKVATAKQIHRDIFSKGTLTVFYRRINKLIKMEYIKRTSHFNGDRNVSIYSLTKKALHKFILVDKKEWSTKRCYSDSVEHDLQLVDIAHKFSKLESYSDYFTENLLKANSSIVKEKELNCHRRLNSDAVYMHEQFDVETKENHTLPISIQYEHTLLNWPNAHNLKALLITM